MGTKKIQKVPSSWLMIGISIIGIIAAFMPWATLGFFSVSGTDGDGVITLIIFAIYGAVGLWLKSQGDPSVLTRIKVLCIILMVLVALIAASDLGNLVSEEDSFIKVSPGAGLYLTLIAGIAGLVVAARLKRFSKSEVPTSK